MKRRSNKNVFHGSDNRKAGKTFWKFHMKRIKKPAWISGRGKINPQFGLNCPTPLCPKRVK